MKLRYKAKTALNGERLHFVDCGPMEMKLTHEQAHHLFIQMCAEWSAPDGERATHDSTNR